MTKKTSHKKKKKGKSKRSVKLPRKLLFIPSSDKDFIEKWTDKVNRDPLNYPASWRMVICGKPGVGKTGFIKNVILRARPKFQRIFIFHQDKFAKEYEDIDGEILTELPDNDFWMGYDEDEAEEDSEKEDEEELVRPKTLLVVDDICFKDLSRVQTARFNRICGFISSHCNISLAVINQDIFEVNSIIRKCASIWVVYRPSCTDELNIIARRCGMPGKDLKYLFDKVAVNENDSITIDKTPGTPYPLRLNGYTILDGSNIKTQASKEE